MAKKQVKQNEQTEVTSGFLNYTFNEDESARFKKWRDEQDISMLNEMVELLIDKGHNFSIKRDNYNDCYSCFIIAPKPEGQTQSLILTGRGKTAMSAVLGALFRHYHVFDGIWPSSTVAKRSTDDD